MGGYLPNTGVQCREMMEAVGVRSLEELYAAAPSELILKDGPNLPPGMAQLAVSRRMEAMAARNTVFPSVFRGAGAYRHYIPPIVPAVVGKETFVTAYTPYQAELSQGILQSIFEYQTMICQLTGLDAANASVYDGASAAAEAVAMCRDRKRSRALVSAAAHPDVVETVRSYCWAAGSEMMLVPAKDGATDLEALEGLLDETVACVYLHQPSYFGVIEDAARAGELAHGAGAKFVMGVNPVAAALLKSPADCGADVAVGEGQPLGMPLSFGGPYLGFMAARQEMARKLPGRIVGQTADKEGKRAFVLTLQAREQHIRREKASSNICSNQALCAMTAAAYLAAVGPEGLGEVARQCVGKAHYLAGRLGEIPGFGRVHGGEFFHEFVTACPVEPERLMAGLEAHGILGGLPVAEGVLWCATEMNGKEEMDRLAELVREVCADAAAV